MIAMTDLGDITKTNIARRNNQMEMRKHFKYAKGMELNSNAVGDYQFTQGYNIPSDIEEYWKQIKLGIQGVNVKQGINAVLSIKQKYDELTQVINNILVSSISDKEKLKIAVENIGTYFKNVERLKRKENEIKEFFLEYCLLSTEEILQISNLTDKYKKQVKYIYSKQDLKNSFYEINSEVDEILKPYKSAYRIGEVLTNNINGLSEEFYKTVFALDKIENPKVVEYFNKVRLKTEKLEDLTRKGISKPQIDLETYLNANYFVIPFTSHSLSDIKQKRDENPYAVVYLKTTSTKNLVNYLKKTAKNEIQPILVELEAVLNALKQETRETENTDNQEQNTQQGSINSARVNIGKHGLKLNPNALNNKQNQSGNGKDIDLGEVKPNPDKLSKGNTEKQEQAENQDNSSNIEKFVKTRTFKVVAGIVIIGGLILILKNNN